MPKLVLTVGEESDGRSIYRRFRTCPRSLSARTDKRRVSGAFLGQEPTSKESTKSSSSHRRTTGQPAKLTDHGSSRRRDVTKSRLDLTRTQVLAFRRHVGALDQRLPRGRRSLRRAAWAGLQDSMPRAALLSIHARVEGTEPSTWEDPSLVQLWGPRFNAYVVAARDLPVFSLGRLPDDAKGRRVAEDQAARLHALLGGTRMTYGEAGRALGEHPNRLRYAAPTGTVVIRVLTARRT